MEFTAWRVTPIFSASSPWVMFASARATLILFFIAHGTFVKEQTLQKVIFQVHCDFRAGFRVCEGVVVVGHRAAAGLGDGVQLVVGQTVTEMTARSPAGTKELIVRIVHLIDAEHGLEAAFVKGTVVRHEGQSGDERLNLPPYHGEHGSVVGVLVRETVHALAEPGVVVGFGMDERVERVGDDTVAHHRHAHAAHAAGLPVGGLEIYGGEVGHG